MNRILVLEDDTLIARSISATASEFGVVTIATTIAEAFAFLENHTVQLTIIDRKLPDGDGLEVIEYLADTSPHTKLVIISQLYSINDRIKAFTNNIIDYLPKPFSREELRIRLKRLHQFNRVTEMAELKTACFSLNSASGEFYIGDKRGRLRPRELQLFTTLWRHRNTTMTRSQLYLMVWQTAGNPTDTTLDVYIRRIRMLIKGSDVLIETIRGFGYRLRVVSDK